MRYLSLFSGIGGFEVAIEEVHGDKAVCVGYSEIDKHAIAEYERHYPDHNNLGDVTLIKKKDIDALGPIDLIVGGFPCSDLSSVKYTNRQGLDGDKSGLFWTMIKIIKWAKTKNPNLKIIAENNASMAHKWRDMITSELTKVFKKPVHCNYFDSSQWVMQRRRRYYWTLDKIPEYTGKRLQKQFLVPLAIARTLQVSDAIHNTHNSRYSVGTSGWIIDMTSRTIQSVKYSTRWKSLLSLTTNNYIKCITTSRPHNLILDTRNNGFFIRYYAKKELNKLFGYPNNYVKTDASSVYQKLYGMTVVPHVIVHILQAM
jgi:site-specific DNA-cytosine methylase